MPLDEVQDHNGNVWKLGWTPPSNGQRLMRASKTSLRALRSALGQPELLPRDQWTPRDYVKGFPLDLIEDQTNIGACSAFTATGSGNRMRHMRGQSYVRLSGFWLYDQVNGGRDRGSNIGEVNEVVRRLGVPPMSSYAKCLWRPNQDPSGVPYYREDVEVTLSTFDEVMTLVIAHGGLAQIPVDASNMDKFTGDGVGIGNYSNPNHSIYVAGAVYLGSTWYALGVTSWRSDWGPFNNGTWLITENQINGCADADDGNAHLSTLIPSGVSTGVPAPVIAI